MKRIAIIPARGGSKRIPRKNIRPFNGKPVIAYAIQAAVKSGIFDKVMVSTDDSGIAEIAQRYGAEVPFMRSKENADDQATTTAVLQEVLEAYAKQGEQFDIACCIYATTPLLTAERLREALTVMEKEETTDVVLPVVRFSYPPQRAFTISEGCLTMADPTMVNVRSQDLTPLYHDAGQFYLFKTASFANSGQLLSGTMRAMELPEVEVQDIDSETDWAMAELKYRWIHAGEGI